MSRLSELKDKAKKKKIELQGSQYGFQTNSLRPVQKKIPFYVVKPDLTGDTSISTFNNPNPIPSNSPHYLPQDSSHLSQQEKQQADNVIAQVQQPSFFDKLGSFLGSKATNLMNTATNSQNKPNPQLTQSGRSVANSITIKNAENFLLPSLQNKPINEVINTKGSVKDTATGFLKGVSQVSNIIPTVGGYLATKASKLGSKEYQDKVTKGVEAYHQKIDDVLQYKNIGEQKGGLAFDVASLGLPVGKIKTLDKVTGDLVNKAIKEGASKKAINAIIENGISGITTKITSKSAQAKNLSVLHPEDAKALTDYIDHVRIGAKVPEAQLQGAERLLQKSGTSLDKPLATLANKAEDIVNGNTRVQTILPGTAKSDSFLGKLKTELTTNKKGFAKNPFVKDEKVTLENKYSNQYGEVSGTPVNITDGLDTFAHKVGSRWVVSDVKTGATLSNSFTTIDKAIQDSKRTVTNYGKPTKTDAPYTKLPQSSIEPPLQGQQLLSDTQVPHENNQATPEKVSAYYNVDRLKISDESKATIKQELSQAGEQLSKTVGKPLTHKEVVATADATSKILDKTVSRSETELKIASNLNLRNKIAQTVENGNVDGSLIDLLIKDKSAGADIARQLEARKNIALPKELASINLLVDGIIKQGHNADEIINSAKGVDFNDPKQATDFYRSFVKPKAKDWLSLIRYNSMLSSPLTQLNNLYSNAVGTSAIAPLEKTVTGLLDKIHSGITGKEREYYTGEGAQYLKGYLGSIGEASKNFMDVMSGKSLDTHPDIHQIPLTTSGAANVAEKVLRVPSKMLSAVDAFFTSLTEGGLNKSLDYRGGKLGKPLIREKGKVADDAAYRLFRGVNEKQGTVLEAIDFVKNKVQEAKSSPNAVLSNIADFTFPFINIGTNLIKQMIEYSPLGVTTFHGATNQKEQLAKLMIGTSSALGAAMLLGQDRLTGPEPTNAKQKQAYRDAGIQPYSMKIGDNWYSYQKLHPALAFNFALIASIDEAIKQQKMSKDDADTILSAFGKAGSFISDQSYAKNIGDLLNASADPEKAASFFGNYPQQLIPFKALMGWVTRIVDPVQRKIDTDGTFLDKQMQQVMMSIPGLSDKVPARLGVGGNEIPQQHPFINAVSPTKVSTPDEQKSNYFQGILDKSKMNADNTYIKEQFKKEAQANSSQANSSQTGTQEAVNAGSDRIAIAYGYDSLLKGDIAGDAPLDTAQKRQQASELKSLYLNTNIPENIKPDIYAKIGLTPDDVDNLMRLDDAGVSLNKNTLKLYKDNGLNQEDVKNIVELKNADIPVSDKTIKLYKENGLDSTDIKNITTMKEDGLTVNAQTIETCGFYKEAKDLPKEEANALAKELFLNDKKSYDELVNIIDYNKHGVSLSEVSKYGVTNGDRATYLYETLSKKDKGEANAIIEELKSKGLVSKTVMKQLVKLIQAHK